MSLDGNESHGFKCVCDELFDCDNFVMDSIWRKWDGAPNDRKVGPAYEHGFVWANFPESARGGAAGCAVGCTASTGSRPSTLRQC